MDYNVYVSFPATNAKMKGTILQIKIREITIALECWE